MKKNRKVIYALIVLVLVACITVWYYVFVWSAHHQRNIAEERSIVVSAPLLVEKFEKSEKNANTVFLDKVVEVSGEILNAGTNQSGKQTIMLKSNDLMSGVFCTMQQNNALLKAGDNVTIKGICTGYLSDVIIIDAVVVKNAY